MTLTVRLLGLVLTAVGLVVATTGLVLLVAPVVGGPPVALDTASPSSPSPTDQSAVMGESISPPVEAPCRSRPPRPRQHG